MKDTFIMQGLIKKFETETGKKFGLFNLNRWFRETAQRMGLTPSDPCCPTFNTGFSPVRFNETSGQLEYFNGTVWYNSLPTSAPTAPVTNDTANTFGFTLATGYTALSNYERTINGGTTWATVTSNPITGITGIKAINTVGVRVMAIATRPASTILFNDVAFT